MSNPFPTSRVLRRRANARRVNGYGSIVHHWQFPTFDLDLSMVKVKLDTLRDR